jgi:uncharacterized protein (UPF0261 family)
MQNDRSACITVVGTLDTKADELAYLVGQIEARDARPVVIDVSTPRRDGISRAEALIQRGDSVGELLLEEYEAGRLDAVVGLGGTGGTELAARAMRRLPRGVPKVILSTVGAGIDRFVGTADITIMRAITDIAGLNPLLRGQLDQLAAAAVAMASAARVRTPRAKRVAALTMFGVTTPAGDVAAEELRRLGWEVVVFHANGTGGATLEELAGEGAFDAVLDLTTTELTDEVAGGQRSAGPTRLTTAGARGLPQVVSLGALDVVNFGPPSSVPPEFAARTFYHHGENVTLMRADHDDARAVAALIAERLNAARGPVLVMVPRRGLSALDVPGGPFDDPETDEVLRVELRRSLADHVDYVERDLHINDEPFARELAQRLDELYHTNEREDHVSTN